MSKLILQGNITQNFGELFPVPYIDRIYVDSPTTDKMELTIEYSFLFLVPRSSEEDFEKDVRVLTETLDRMNFYMLIGRAPTLKGAQADMIMRKKAVAKRLGEGITDAPFGKAAASLRDLRNPYSALDLLTYDSSYLFDIIKNIEPGSSDKLIDIDERILAKKVREGELENFTTDGENRIIKIQSSVKQVISTARKPIASGGLGAAADLCLFAFASLLDVEGLKSKEFSRAIPTNRAAALYFGDVAYEKILISDGNPVSPTFKMPDQTQMLYFDLNNELYTDTPIQTLDSLYHKVPSQTRQEVYQKFSALVDSYLPLVEDEKSQKKSRQTRYLSSAVDSIQYVLSTASNSIEFLLHLNKARRTIPERSTGTAAGQFYEDIGTMLQRANAVVGREPQVVKRLVSNSKIIDRRHRLGQSVLPDPIFVAKNIVSEDVLLQNFLLDRSVVTVKQFSKRISFAAYDVAAETRFEGYLDGFGADEFESYDDDDYLIMQLQDGTTYEHVDDEYKGLLNDNYFALEEYNVSFGYFFFDYDLAIRKNSYIANVFNVQKVIDYFGMPFLQAYFQPMRVKLWKYAPTTSAVSPIGSPIMTFDFPLSSEDAPEFGGLLSEEYLPGGSYASAHGSIERTDRAPHPAYPEKIDIISSTTGADTTTINSYVAQRALNMLNTDMFVPPAVSCEVIYGPVVQPAFVNNTYRLMAFEFQNIDQAATLDKYMDKVTDRYDYGITLMDGTKQAILRIIDNFRMNMEAYEENYVKLARQFCSYNNLEGTFNDFFITAMNDRYASDPTSAPWTYAISMYIKHLEFLTNRHDGSTANQLIEAKEILQRIAPETGTLEQVESFLERLKNTFEDFYGHSSPIGKYLSTDDGTGGTGREGMWEPETFRLEYKSTWEGTQRSSFIPEDRNNYLSLINTERDRYLDAEAAYDAAIRRAEIPPMDVEVAVVDCKPTDPECDACTGKIWSADWLACVCPPGQVESAETGKCGMPSLFADDDEGSRGAEEVAEVDEEKVTYEANKIKKRSPKKAGECSASTGRDANDCQYVKQKKCAPGDAPPAPAGESDPKCWYWYKPKGVDDRGEVYNVNKYGEPSYWATRIRDVHCWNKTWRPKKKKYCKCRSKHGHGSWESENWDLSAVKAKIRHWLTPGASH